MDKEKRLMLWLGKFAFPEVDTKVTKIQFVPANHHVYRLPIVEPLDINNYMDLSPYFELKTEDVKLQDYGYRSKRKKVFIRLGYAEANNVLLVSDGSFQYIK